MEGVEVWTDEWRERRSTTIQAAGAYVIAVETVVPSRTAGLSSCYLTASVDCLQATTPDVVAEQTAVAHLLTDNIEARR